MKKVLLILVILLSIIIISGCSSDTDLPLDGNKDEIKNDDNINNDKKLIVHYYRYDNDYDNWTFWIWPDGGDGAAYEFTGEDEFGKVSEIPIKEDVNKVGIIPRLGNWEKKDIDMDRFIDLDDDITHVWIIQGTEKIYYDSKKANKSPKINRAFLDSTRDIFVELSSKVELLGENNENFKVLSDGKEISIKEVSGIGVKQEKVRENGYELLVKDTVIKFVFSPNTFDYTVKDGEDVYIIGEFNDYNIDENYKLKKNEVYGTYEILLDIEENSNIKYGQDFSFVVIDNNEKTFIKDGLVIDKYNGKSTNLFNISLDEDIDIKRTITVEHKDLKERTVEMRDILESEEYTYLGDDLGANYNDDYTLFKVWSPVAQDMEIVLYDNYDDNNGVTYPMTLGEKGVWELKLDGNYSNKYYNYRVTINGNEKETPDPYAKGASANGTKSMIVDFSKINPTGWEDHNTPKGIKRAESIIYEMHVRDFSVYENSGIKNKGKYLAFTEEGTRGPGGVSTGLDHLKDLGITHLHLLPVYDFASVDETKGGYNWGYDPYLYNVPEGSYSTDPYDGKVRIKEFKEMVKSLHENDIRVVMDVVFNHTYTTGNSPFDILVPKYYYRTNPNGTYSNGSGCGNETASEKAMMRKFIVDSVKYWATEYKIDGFRFDLMALHDIETMREVEKELKKINPNILIYGEPWSGGTSTLSPTLQVRKGSQKGMDVSVFNDDIRNAIKGDNDGTGLGFVSGGLGLEKEIKKGIVGSIEYDNSIKGFTKEPKEAINYVSSHDNLALFDKFEKSNPINNEDERERMNRLSLSMVLSSQGVPFIQGGTEILRTKKGDHNSYMSGDSINQIDWSRKNTYNETYKYIKGLIALRKSQRVMTLESSENVKKSLEFIDSPKNTVAYILKSLYRGDYDNIYIIHNGNKEEVIIKLPLEGEWTLIADGDKVDTNGLGSAKDSITVKGISTYILYKNN